MFALIYMNTGKFIIFVLGGIVKVKRQIANRPGYAAYRRNVRMPI